VIAGGYRSAACCIAGLLVGCSGQPTLPPNLLLIVLDTTRWDAVGAESGKPTHTPNLDALAAEGTIFTQARTTSAWTVPAHASLFTGLYPSRHGAHWENSSLAPQHTTLAELLAPTHETVGFSENPHIVAEKGYAQGFDQFEDVWRWRRGPNKPSVTLEVFDKWFKKRDRSRPFFAFVNLMAPHLPYNPPARHRAHFVSPSNAARARQLSRIGESEARQIIAGQTPLSELDFQLLRQLYRAEVSFADELVGIILDWLEADGVLDDTLVVVVGDHGENIGDHGLMEHQLCLYESLLRIPLILRLPGKFEGGARRHEPVQLVDLLPTVLDLMGVSKAEGSSIEGRSLVPVPLDRNRPSYAEYMRPTPQRSLFERSAPDFDFSPHHRRLKSIQVGTLKLIASERGERELYDLSVDPDEQNDLAGERPDDTARLASQLEDWARGWQPVVDPAPRAVDAERLKALRELGYVE